MKPAVCALVLALLPSAGWTQTSTVRVFSEFTRIGSDGKVIAADQGTEPRTILSPGVVRNGFASFRIVVQPPSSGKYHLEIGQNPENIFKAVLYREGVSPEGIPDVLTPVSMPHEGMAVDGKAVTYWLDLWLPAETTPDRIKVEPQLWFKDDWFTYPMEVRILERLAKEQAAMKNGNLPGVTERADRPVLLAFRETYCQTSARPPELGESKPRPGEPLTVRQLVYRNALQALGLASNKEAIRIALLKVGATEVCSGKFPEGGPEWFLKIRDALQGVEP